MDKNMSANIAGVAGAMAMMGVTMASRKLGATEGTKLAEKTAEQGLEVVGIESNISEEQEQALGMGVHMGFSMSSAMLYARLRHFIGIPGPLAGALFGAGLWAINVAGVAPMVGIQRAPWKQDEAKAMTTLLSHVVFGVVLGLLYDRLVDEA